MKHLLDIQIKECIKDKQIVKLLFQKEKEEFDSLIINIIKDPGKMEKCMEQANFNGFRMMQQFLHTKDNISMEKNKDQEK